MILNGYSPYVPPVPGPLHEMAEADARLSFEDFLASRGDRLAELQRAVGDDVVIDLTRSSLGLVEGWMRAEVHLDSRDNERLEPLTYGLCFDIGILLGEVMIRESPTLAWSLALAGGPRSAYCQRPVVSGFTKVRNRDYAIDPEMLVIGRAYDFAADRSAPLGAFDAVLNQARARA